MLYSPGDVFYQQFTTVNGSGYTANMDVLWSTLVKNGMDDLSVKVFTQNVDVGRYTVSGIIPITYPAKTSINLSISGLVNGQVQKRIIKCGSLRSTTDVNVVSWLNAPVAPLSVSGTVVVDLKFVNTKPATTYDGIAQSGTANTITLSPNDSSMDNLYQNQYISIVGGKGMGQVGIVTSYNGLLKTATVQTPFNNGNWLVIPDQTSQYSFVGLALITNTFSGVVTTQNVSNFTLAQIR